MEVKKDCEAVWTQKMAGPAFPGVGKRGRRFHYSRK